MSKPTVLLGSRLPALQHSTPRISSRTANVTRNSSEAERRLHTHQLQQSAILKASKAESQSTSRSELKRSGCRGLTSSASHNGLHANRSISAWKSNANPVKSPPRSAEATVADEDNSEEVPQGPVAPSSRIDNNTRRSSPLFTSESDEDLRAIFDTPSSILAQSSTTSVLTPTGLFLHPKLTDPTYLQVLTTQTLIHAQHVVDRINCILPDFQPSFSDSPFRALSPDTIEFTRTLRLVPKNLDRLSDILCLVIDMAELIRNTHPDPEWVDEAERAYERLGSYMNGLNTNVDLYKALNLCLSVNSRGTFGPGNELTPTELQLIDTFMKDFEKSGIHLPPQARQSFVRLSDEIQILGRKFLADVAQHSGFGSDPEHDPAGVMTARAASEDMIEIPEHYLSGLGQAFIDSLPRGSTLTGSREKRYVGPNSWAAQYILRRSPDERARRLVYKGTYRTSEDRVRVLETLLKKRAELANVLGKASWAEVALGDKMAKSPDNVMQFLTSLASHHRPSALADIALLSQMKEKEFRTTTDSLIRAWDRDYYSDKYLSSLGPPGRLYPVSPFFSAGTVIQGLSRLFSRLYGVRFVPSEMRPSESWHPDVRKLEVVDEVEGPIGIIYFDLFARPGKPSHAAHYTVRCSRRIDDDDVPGDLLPPDWDWSAGMTGVEDHNGVSVRGKSGRYQLPLVVLTTDFAPPTTSSGPSLLSWPEVETLFHEMGHAIHSMFGRTEYHNVSGTRCATDFVELPSIIMESFAASPDVLPLFARHYHTDAPLSLNHFQAHRNMHASLSAMETNAQITMSTLDQLYHSELAQRKEFDSTKIYHNLQEEQGVIPPVGMTAWQTQFGHLYGYGATYYSYLFDRAIAEQVFSKLFKQDATSREMGEKFRNDVLKWGGSKDPWDMVAQVVGDDSLVKGDTHAMETVGRWMKR